MRRGGEVLRGGDVLRGGEVMRGGVVLLVGWREIFPIVAEVVRRHVVEGGIGVVVLPRFE